jgi:hypothetical protein
VQAAKHGRCTSDFRRAAAAAGLDRSTMHDRGRLMAASATARQVFEHRKSGRCHDSAHTTLNSWASVIRAMITNRIDCPRADLPQPPPPGSLDIQNKQRWVLWEKNRRVLTDIEPISSPHAPRFRAVARCPGFRAALRLRRNENFNVWEPTIQKRRANCQESPSTGSTTTSAGRA